MKFSKSLSIVMCGLTFSFNTMANDSDVKGSRIKNEGKEASIKTEEPRLEKFRADTIFKVCGYPPTLSSFPSINSVDQFALKLKSVDTFNACARASKFKYGEIKYAEFVSSANKIEICKKELKETHVQFFEDQYLKAYNVERGQEKSLTSFSDVNFTEYTKKQAQLCEDVKKGKYNKDIFTILSQEYSRCENFMSQKHRDSFKKMTSFFKTVNQKIASTQTKQAISDDQIASLKKDLKTCQDDLAKLNAAQVYDGHGYFKDEIDDRRPFFKLPPETLDR